MKKYFAYILLLLIHACETPSDIKIEDFDNEKVLTSFIYPDSDIIVNIYNSIAYTDTIFYTNIGNSTIELSINDSITHTKTISSNDNYVSFGKMDFSDYDKIKISVLTNQNDYLEASTTILPRPEILSIDTLHTNIKGNRVLISLTFKDNKSSHDYYQIVARKRDILPNGQNIISKYKCNYVDNIFNADNTNISNSNSIGLFTDNKTDSIYTVKFYIYDIEPIKNHDTYADILLYRHTNDYYYYAKSVNSIKSDVVLPVFVVPTIYSNVTGGYGIVSAMSYSIISIKMN